MPEDPRFTDDSSQASSEEQRLENDSVQTPNESKYEEGRELSPNQGVTEYGNSEINPLEEVIVKQPIPERTYVPQINNDLEITNASTFEASLSSISPTFSGETDNQFEEPIEVEQEAVEQTSASANILSNQTRNGARAGASERSPNPSRNQNPNRSQSRSPNQNQNPSRNQTRSLNPSRSQNLNRSQSRSQEPEPEPEPGNQNRSQNLNRSQSRSPNPSWN